MNRTTAALAFLSLLLASCGDDPAPKPPVPAWANVAPEQIAEAEKHGVPVAFENDLGMRFVLIPAGTFLMGSPEEEEGRYQDETQHEVTISRPFYMQITEVTNEQYRGFLPLSAELLKLEAPPEDEARPALTTHTRSCHFAAWLSSRSNRRSYRLPREAEWEYACRAGTRTPYWWGSKIRDATAHEHYKGAVQSDDPEDPGWTPGEFGTPTDVAQYQANPWGLYDMLGNAREYCLDWYRLYVADHLDGYPVGRLFHIVVRGGHPVVFNAWCRSAYRDSADPDTGVSWTGFRLVSPLP